MIIAITSEAGFNPDPRAHTQQDLDYARLTCLQVLGVACCCSMRLVARRMAVVSRFAEAEGRQTPVVVVMANGKTDIGPRAPVRSQSPSDSRPPGAL